MRKLLIAVVVMCVLALPMMAGEHQAESMEYERAFAAGQYQVASQLAKTGVGQGNALNALGFAAYETNNFAKAKGYLERAIEADPEQYWAYNTLGAILLYEGDVDGAIANFEKSAEVNAKANDADAAARVRKAERNIETARLYL